MTGAGEHTCERCGARFFYDPRHHRCPGEWEALVAEQPPLASPCEGMTWVEESMAKQREER